MSIQSVEAGIEFSVWKPALSISVEKIALAAVARDGARRGGTVGGRGELVPMDCRRGAHPEGFSRLNRLLVDRDLGMHLVGSWRWDGERGRSGGRVEDVQRHAMVRQVVRGEQTPKTEAAISAVEKR